MIFKYRRSESVKPLKYLYESMDFRNICTTCIDGTLLLMSVNHLGTLMFCFTILNAIIISWTNYALNTHYMAALTLLEKMLFIGILQKCLPYTELGLSLVRLDQGFSNGGPRTLGGPRGDWWGSAKCPLKILFFEDF